MLVPIAHGTEELEAIAIVDIARRAGIRVRLAGESENVICSRGIRIAPDVLWRDVDDSDTFDAIVLPGGRTGTERFIESDESCTLCAATPPKVHCSAQSALHRLHCTLQVCCHLRAH